MSRDFDCVYDEGQLAAGAARAEWVLANGLGGFAMGSAAGVPERRYHAWLIAATTPPVGRVVTLQSCSETLVVEGVDAAGRVVLRRHPLSSHRFGGAAGPTARERLVRFEKGVSCRWTYRVEVADGGVVEVTRELVLYRGRNAAAVRYVVRGVGAGVVGEAGVVGVEGVEGPIGAKAWLEVRPLLAMRDFHGLLREGDGEGRFAVTAAEGGPDVAAGASVDVVAAGTHLALDVGLEGGGGAGRFSTDRAWWRDLDYVRDRERGQDGREDLFSPGTFVVECGAGAAGAGAAIVLRAWSRPGPAGETDGPGAVDDELARQQERRDSIAEAVVRGSGAVDADDRAALTALSHAADQFIVQREAPAAAGLPGGTHLASIIAGYPWFSDWGRDTMISMPGLMLTGDQPERARDALRAFGALRRNGLIPNTFDNATGAAQFNTVDAPLWYVHAACDYLRKTGDRTGFDGTIRGACLEIVERYRSGTDYGIRMDPVDGLIAAGDATTQLTWMDAKRDGVVFTPRHGKAVEINALWYSGLLELAEAVEGDAPRAARELRQVADLAGRSFERQFWNAELGCLYDVLMPAGMGWEAAIEVRPNQIFAVSLPHSALSYQARAAVVACVRERLLTPVGLRTLDAGDRKYRARFEGDLMSRDGAYHNGTVWPWLIGPYAEAVLRLGEFSAAARAEAMGALRPLLEEFARAGARGGPVATLAEVYDAEPREDGFRKAEGCMAQAWSVAEVLRVYAMACGK